MLDIRVISIGALATHPLWGERKTAANAGPRTGHATTTLVRSGKVTLLIDPGLPEAALVARLDERAGLSPEAITHVFLTSVHPDTHRGIGAFSHAEWLISRDEREGVGIPLVQQLKIATDQGETELTDLLKQQIAILHRCKEAPDELAPRADIFPLPGLTPGLSGVLVEDGEQTVLVCGDAIPTVEHLRRKMILPNASSVPKARESFAEAIQIGDVLVLGRDNAVVNPFDAGAADAPDASA
jgi:glyoxylase-like metal-dependent hydrolase (beta-lactamase superfamily II)